MGKNYLSETEPCLSRGIRWKTLWDSYGMHHPQHTPWKAPSMTLMTKYKMGWPMQRGRSCMSVSPKTTSVWLWITGELCLSTAVRTTPITVRQVAQGNQTPFQRNCPSIVETRTEGSQADSTWRLSTHGAGPVGVWNPGYPVKPSDKLQQVAGISSLSRLIKGWSKKTKEVDSRNLIFQHLKAGAWGRGGVLPVSLSGFTS